MKVLLLFVDGVGIGEAGAHNPFCAARLPVITALLGGLPVAGPGGARRGVSTAASLVPLDATLGVSGRPQSGTGQTTLLTGRNAAMEYGRHFGPWVPSTLRPMLRAENILTRARRAGLATAFANACPRELIDAANSGIPARRRPPFINAGPPLAAAGAGVFERSVDELRSGNAVASEITNDGWRDRLGVADLPMPIAQQAGATLARIASQNRLTLFAHYATDTAGHAQDVQHAVSALERLDTFLGGVMTGLTDDTVVIVVSDHGNIEDVRTGHTLNPALGIIAGARHAEYVNGVTSLLHVTPLIARMLDVA
jgi:hypothetical protein